MCLHEIINNFILFNLNSNEVLYFTAYDTRSLVKFSTVRLEIFIILMSLTECPV